MANFQKIRELCSERGITLAELAEQIGITPAGVTSIIKSNATNTNTIERIAQVLNVKVGYFFDEEPESAEEPQDPNSVIAQKDAIIAQKDKIIEQKDMLINILMANRQ